jgi:hypothetical protein
VWNVHVISKILSRIVRMSAAVYSFRFGVFERANKIAGLNGNGHRHVLLTSSKHIRRTILVLSCLILKSLIIREEKLILLPRAQCCAMHCMFTPKFFCFSHMSLLSISARLKFELGLETQNVKFWRTFPRIDVFYSLWILVSTMSKANKHIMYDKTKLTERWRIEQGCPFGIRWYQKKLFIEKLVVERFWKDS